MDRFLKDILDKSNLTGKKSKDRWMEISDPRNYDIHEPVLYEMNDGYQFLAFLDTPNNISLNRISLKAFSRSPSSKIIYFQRKSIRLGHYVPNVHPGFKGDRALAINEMLKPEV